jgi:Cu/Ag efflux protein CusF
MTRRAVILLLVAIVLATAGCSREEVEPAPQEQPAQKWTVKGKLEGMNPEQKTVTINHQDIPGLMAAMTMAFQVEEAGILEGFSEGDAVEFVLEQKPSGLTVTSLRAITEAELEATRDGRTFEGKGMVMVVNRNVGAIVLQQEGAGDLPPGELVLPVVPPSQLEGLEDETPVEFVLTMKDGQLVVSELKALPKE